MANSATASAALRLFEMEDIRKPAAEEGALPEARPCRKGGGGTAGLEVRIEDQLHDRQHATGLEGAEEFGERGGAVGDLPQDGDQNNAVEVVGGEFPLAETGGEKVHVRKSRSLGLLSGPGEHSRLDVHRDDAAFRADAPGEGDGEASGAAPRVKNGHAGRQGEGLHDERGPVHLGEGVVHLDEPAEPHRAGQALAAGDEAVCPTDEGDGDDDEKKGRRGAHDAHAPAAGGEGGKAGEAGSASGTGKEGTTGETRHSTEAAKAPEAASAGQGSGAGEADGIKTGRAGKTGRTGMTDKTDMNGKAGKTEETVKQEPSAHTIVIPPLPFPPGAGNTRIQAPSVP